MFADIAGVRRIVVDTPAGSFGLLPHRLDCVTALTPGLLLYETQEHDEVFLAVDEGVLVKTGPQVLVSVRRAMGGTDLAHLHARVEREYLTLDEDERSLREVSAKLENGFLHRFAEVQRD
ncbi:F0F1 ATP synthase subunit epsilon [Thiomonas sp. FB-6]|uniref:F0F1 ATP synthase subunit epsilon n=1 Tax=Thiomonas sp. FB-6 TaxID=1158291 RepID=UPI00037A8F1A|nr:F0F1 ATP synthase subunit epsilon [Thiomonas sp. FB-6]